MGAAASELMGRLSQNIRQVQLLDGESQQAKPRNCKDIVGKTEVVFNLFPFFFLWGILVVGFSVQLVQFWGGCMLLFIYLICCLCGICAFNNFQFYSSEIMTFSSYFLHESHSKNGQRNLSCSFSCSCVSLTVTLPWKQVGTFSLKMYSLSAGITVLI